MTTIHITNLRARAIIGVFAWEQKVKQDLCLNLELRCALPAIAADCAELEQTVDYKSLNKKIIAAVEGGRFYLLEGLAQLLLGLVFSHDARIERARLRIDKPGALRFADSVAVEVSSERSEWEASS